MTHLRGSPDVVEEVCTPFPGQGQRYPTWADMVATGRYLTSAQEGSGAIPWEPGRHTDVWDHLECVMALSATGFLAEADAGLAWLARTQRPDGTWPIRTVGDRVEDTGFDTNHCAYVAVATWHRWLVSPDEALLDRMLPVVTAALDAVVAHQRPSGVVAWAVDVAGQAMPTGLLAGTSSIWQALDCGIRLAELRGQDASTWLAARDRAGAAVRAGSADFEEKHRYSMDWYYPVLAGPLRGADARLRLDERWSDFVRDGLGARCVDDHPWVTGAETCELAMATEALGEKETARRLVTDVQHLRETDGSYHTGLVYSDGKRWPIERSTWTAAAVVLAVDAIDEVTPASGIFRSTSPVS